MSEDDEMRARYDSELPFLAELEGLLRARAVMAQAATAGGPAPVRTRRQLSGGRARVGFGDAHELRIHRPQQQIDPPPRRSRRGAAWAARGSAARVARRTLTLALLGCLIGASALATKSLVTSSTPSDPGLRTSAATTLGTGGAGADAWTLSAYRRGVELCHDFLVARTLASSCDLPPSADGVVTDGAITPTRRFVVGFAGERVGSIEIQTGKRHLRVPTRQLPDAAAGRAASIPTDVRWFVAPLPRPSYRPGPAHVTPLDMRGRALGAPQLECGIAPASTACQVAGQP